MTNKRIRIPPLADPDVRDAFQRISNYFDLVVPALDEDESVTGYWTFQNGLASNGNITMAEDTWIGMGAALPRLVWQTTTTAEFRDCLTFANTADSTSDARIDVTNSNVGASAGALLRAFTAGGGDAFCWFGIGVAANWSAGVDNSDSDKYKIHNASTLADTSLFELDSSGNLAIAGSLSITDGSYVGIASNERFVFNAAGYITLTGAYLRLGTNGIGNNTSVLTFATGVAGGHATFTGDVTAENLYLPGTSGANIGILTDGYFAFNNGGSITVNGANFLLGSNGLGNSASVLTFAAGGTGAATFGGDIYIGANGIGNNASVLTFGAGSTGGATFGGSGFFTGACNVTRDFDGNAQMQWLNNVSSHANAGTLTKMQTAGGGDVVISMLLPSSVYWSFGIDNSDSDAFKIHIASTLADASLFEIDRSGHTFLANVAGGNVVSGFQAALATNATDGFLHIPMCAGAPTGAATSYTGKGALVYDSTNDTLYIREGGAWATVGGGDFLPLAGGTMAGTIVMDGNDITTVGNITTGGYTWAGGTNTIAATTSDASDSTILLLAGGGAADATRGALMALYGNEANTGGFFYGSVFIQAGASGQGGPTADAVHIYAGGLPVAQFGSGTGTQFFGTLLMTTITEINWRDADLAMWSSADSILKIKADGYVQINGLFDLETTSSTTGQITQNGGTRLIHTYGSNNFFAGTSAGNFTLTSADSCVGVGGNCLDALTTGDDNTAAGYNAGSKISTGARNSIFGHNAGFNIVGGSNNCAFGDEALVGGTSCAGTVAMGQGAIGNASFSGSGCVAVGFVALYDATSAIGCTGVGQESLENLTSGDYCVSIGFQSLHFLTTADYVVAVGYRAGFVSDADGGVFLGKQAGYFETDPNKLFIDNALRTNEADGRVKALVYGVFAAATADQYLTFNANVTVRETLTSSAGRILSTTRVTSGPYAVLASDHAIFGDTDGGAFEVDLPAGVDGTEYVIINAGTSGLDLTVDPNGTEEIAKGGAGVAVVLTDGESLRIIFETTEHWMPA